VKSPLSKQAHQLPYSEENMEEIFRLDFLYPSGANEFRSIDLPDSVLLAIF